MIHADRTLSRAGFTLVELVVAMAISLVVLLTTLELFNNSQRSYVMQEGVAEVQQNVRTAKLFIERDIRMAGAGIPNFSFGGVAVYPLEFENNVDGTSGVAATIPNIVEGTDILRVRYQDFSVNGCGTDPAGSLASCDTLSQLTLAANMPTTATVADVNEDVTAGGWDSGCFCNGTSYTQPTPNMPFIVTAADGSQSAVLFLTSTLPLPGFDRIGNGPNVTYQGVTYENKLLNTFPSGSIINFFNPAGIYNALYSIQNQNGVPCLIRDTGSGSQVIAEYIEDLQLAFELDTNDDGLVDATVNDADLTDLQKSQVRMVRINLLARSAHAQPNFTGQRPAMEDHLAGVVDSFRRRQLTVTIKVRNLGL